MTAPQRLARVVAFLMACGKKGGRVQGHVLAQLVPGLDLGARPQRAAVARMDREEGRGNERLVVVVGIVHRRGRDYTRRHEWYNLGLPKRHRGTAMSADRDRGIRRIKQKRAKAQKRDERRQRSESVAKRTTGAAPARRPA